MTAWRHNCGVTRLKFMFRPFKIFKKKNQKKKDRKRWQATYKGLGSRERRPGAAIEVLHGSGTCSVLNKRLESINFKNNRLQITYVRLGARERRPGAAIEALLDSSECSVLLKIKREE